jgi:hypothetical protein
MRAARVAWLVRHSSGLYVGERAIGDDGGVGEVERGDRKIETGTVSAGTAAFGSFFGLALPVSFFITFLTPSAFLGA